MARSTAQQSCLISINAGHVDAETASLLRQAAQNCKELQCVELAFSTGLTEEDALLFLAAPSVRFVSIEGLPFAKKLRAGYAGKCVETFGEDAHSRRFHAYVNEATAFLDDMAALDQYTASGDAQFADKPSIDVDFNDSDVKCRRAFVIAQCDVGTIVEQKPDQFDIF